MYTRMFSGLILLSVFSCSFPQKATAECDCGADKIIASASQYDGQVIKAQGVLVFNSAGFFLFDNCASKLTGDISKAIKLPTGIGRQVADGDLFDAEIIVKGMFSAGKKELLNSWNKFSDLAEMTRLRSSGCDPKR